jgi:TonB family protein
MALSIALHAVIILLLAVQLTRAAKPLPPPQPKPITFKFVDQPKSPPPDRPPREEAPISDVDRAARSPDAKPGEPKALQPKMQGQTAQMVLPKAPPPSPAPSRQPKPEVRERPKPKPKPPTPKPSPTPAPKVKEPEPKKPSPDDRRRSILARLAELEKGDLYNERFDSPDEDFFGTPDGDISFETRGVDWGPYAARLHRIVKRNWMIPPAAQIGTKGVVRIRFEIHRDGSISKLEIMDESGTRSLDDAAYAAIANSHPLPPPPLPDTWHKDTVGVRWTFYYNTRAR